MVRDYLLAGDMTSRLVATMSSTPRSFRTYNKNKSHISIY